VLLPLFGILHLEFELARGEPQHGIAFKSTRRGIADHLLVLQRNLARSHKQGLLLRRLLSPTAGRPELVPVAGCPGLTTESGLKIDLLARFQSYFYRHVKSEDIDSMLWDALAIGGGNGRRVLVKELPDVRKFHGLLAHVADANHQGDGFAMVVDL